MSYTNRKFNWDLDALKRFYNNYVIKWLNAAMSWTAAQKKQARANLGFGNGDIDDEPTAGSHNLVESGAVFNDKLYLNDYRKKSEMFGTGYINSNQRWENVGTATAAVLRVKQGDVLKIKASTIKSAVIAILASYSPKDGENADFASGESGRRTVANNTSAEIEISAQDASFVFIAFVSGDNNYTPAEVSINGYNLNLSMQEHILRLDQEIENTNNKIGFKETLTNTVSTVPNTSYTNRILFGKVINSGTVNVKVTGDVGIVAGDKLTLSIRDENDDVVTVISAFVYPYEYTINASEMPLRGVIALRSNADKVTGTGDITLSVLIDTEKYAHKEDVNELKEDVFNLTEKTIYVATDGLDTNDGSIQAPLASINSALSKGNNIIIRGGVYKNQLIDLSLCNGNIQIKAYTGEKVSILNNIVATSATKVSGYTKVYSCPITVDVSARNWLFQFGVNDISTLINDSDRTYIHSRKKYRCDCTRLVRVDSIAAIDNWEGFSWYEENGTLYFSSPELLSSDKPLFVGGGNLLSGTDNKTLRINGIRSYGKKFNLVNLFNCEVCNCAAIGCTGGGGFLLNLSQNMVLKMCEAAFCDDTVSSTTGDGFNVHSSSAITIGTTDMGSVFSTFSLIDCWAHDNFNDGYSDHEGCNGHIQNGVYEFNCCGADGMGGHTNGVGNNGHGGGIVPAHGAHDVIFGAICQRNFDDGVRYTSNADMTPQGCEVGTFTAIGVISRNNAHYGFKVSRDNQIVDVLNCIATGNGTDNYHSENGAVMRMSVANSQNA